MAGSKREFQYETDGGLKFAVSLDESNTEAINTTLNANELNPIAGQILLPVARFCRSVIYTSADKRVSRRIVVLRKTVLGAMPATIQVSVSTGASTQETVELKQGKGRNEKFSPATIGVTDSGLTDGDGGTVAVAN